MNHAAVTRSQGVLVLAQVGRLLLFVAVTGWLGRSLTPEDFGFVALVTSILLAAIEVLDMGSGAAATRQIAREPASERQTLNALLVWRRLVALALCSLIGVIALASPWVPPSGGQRWALLVVALVVYLLHQTAYHVVFQVRQAYGQAVLLNWCGYLVFVIGCVAALQAHAGGAVIALVVALRELVQVLGSRWLASHLLGYRLKARWLDAGIRPLWRAGWLIGVAGVCYKLVAHAPGFLLWAWGPPSEMGSFGAAQRLVLPLADTAWLYATPLIAAFSAFSAQDPAEFHRQLERHVGFMAGVAASIAVAGCFVAPALLRLLYGERYSAGAGSAVEPLRWLAAACLFALVTPVLAVASVARGHEKSLAIVATLGLALVLAVASAAMAWGEDETARARDAAAAQCVGEAFVCTVLLAIAARRGELVFAVRGLVTLLPAMALAAVLWALQSMPQTQLVVAVLFVLSTAAWLLRRHRQGSSVAAVFDSSNAGVPASSALHTSHPVGPSTGEPG